MFKKIILAASIFLMPFAAMAQTQTACTTPEEIVADGKASGAEEVFTLSGTDLEALAAKLAETNPDAAVALLSMDQVKYFKIDRYPDAVFVAMFKDNCMKNFGTIGVKDYNRMRDHLKGV